MLWVCCGGPFSWLNERVARKLTATQCQMKLSLLKNKLKLFLMLQSESPIEETALADKQVNWSSNVVTPYSGVAIGAEQKVFLGRIGPTRERECVRVCSLYRPSLLYLPRSYLFPSRASPNFITYSNQITKGVQQGPKPRFERENRTHTTTPDEISAHRAADPSRKQLKTLKRVMPHEHGVLRLLQG